MSPVSEEPSGRGESLEPLVYDNLTTKIGATLSLLSLYVSESCFPSASSTHFY